MKVIYFWTIVLLAIALIAAGPLHAADLEIVVDEPVETGVIRVALFDAPNTFGDLRDPVREVSCRPGDCLIRDIPAGEYAIVVFEDRNGNGVLDRNFIGIPVEPLGFANSYSPKGPPTWERAKFVLTDDATETMIVSLSRPLGDRGRIGVGPGLIFQTSPYVDDDSLVTQPIPAITWQGNRVQILGPVVRVGLAGSDALRLAATARYRIGVYEESDSPVLEGLGDRDGTLMGGLALVSELPAGFELTVEYQHDVLDQIGGGEAELSIEKSFQAGRLVLSPELSARWSSADLANHDFGVSAEGATPARPAYEPGDTLNWGGGIGVRMEITRDWGAFASFELELLDDAITRSPIVEDDTVVSGFLAVSYLF